MDACVYAYILVYMYKSMQSQWTRRESQEECGVPAYHWGKDKRTNKMKRTGHFTIFRGIISCGGLTERNPSQDTPLRSVSTPPNSASASAPRCNTFACIVLSWRVNSFRQTNTCRHFLRLSPSKKRIEKKNTIKLHGNHHSSA